jgi:hypothetical protein
MISRDNKFKLRSLPSHIYLWSETHFDIVQNCVMKELNAVVGGQDPGNRIQGVLNKCT